MYVALTSYLLTGQSGELYIKVLFFYRAFLLLGYGAVIVHCSDNQLFEV